MIQRRKYYLAKEKKLEAMRANKLRKMQRLHDKPGYDVKFRILLREKSNDIHQY